MPEFLGTELTHKILDNALVKAHTQIIEYELQEKEEVIDLLCLHLVAHSKAEKKPISILDCKRSLLGIPDEDDEDYCW